MPDLRTQLRDYFEEIAPPVSPDEARGVADVMIPAAPATVSRPRRLLPIVVGFVVVVLALLAAGLLGPQTPEEPVIGPTPTTVPVEEPTTTTVTGARVDQAALARARWVTHGPDGLRTDDGTLLWETEVVLGTTFVARDGEGGLVYVDAQGLWWIAAGAETPQLVAGEEVLLPDPTLVEVIPTSSGPVARIGFGDSRYLDLTTGELLAEGPPGRVQSDGSWATANGLGVRIVGPDVIWEAEGGIEEVLEPAHLVVEQGDEILADVVVGTVREPFAMVHDFDGRTLILSRYPHEPALPAVPFFIIDLGCADCLVTFQAGATWVALVGPDTDWSGPVEAPDRSTPPLSESAPCESAPFRVTILPWLARGEPLPEPEPSTAEGSSILTWEGPPGTAHEGGRGHVAIVRHPLPEPLGGPDHPVDVPVRGTFGEIQWVGDPGVGEVRLAWLEDDGSCGSYTLHLWDITLTEEEAEQYLRQAAASLTEP